MKLVITDENGFVDIDFGEWLVERIKLYILSKIAKYDFSRWDHFINNDSSWKKLYSRPYTCYNLLKSVVDEIIVSEVSDGIMIHVDPDKFLIGYDRVKLLVFAKTLNYGTLGIKGTSLFTDSFNHFEKNIKLFFNMYYETYW